MFCYARFRYVGLSCDKMSWAKISYGMVCLVKLRQVKRYMSGCVALCCVQFRYAGLGWVKLGILS